MFLDATYFRGELYLPGLKVSEGTCGVARMLQTVAENSLDWFVLKYEREFLDKLLGRTLAANFVAGIQANEIAQEWLDLKNAIYTQDNHFSFSPAANYVYYWVMRTGRTQTTPKGEVKATADFSVAVPDTAKLVKAWNDMMPFIHYIREWLCDNQDTYAPFSGADLLHYFEPINAFNL